MSDYSQHGEQEIILRWAREHANGTPGSFLDLGCYDGATGSNTAALVEAGWGGLMVDAAPDAIADCARRYAGHADVDVLAGCFDHRQAAGETFGPAVIDWTPAGQYSGLEANPRDDVDHLRLLVDRIDLAWLAQWCAAQPAPLFVSIDLEGESIDALRWVAAATPAGCVCVEANTPADRAAAVETLPGWQQLLVNNWNSIFARA